MDIQKEREAFELAYIESRKDCPLAKSDILELLDGSYLVSRVDDSWNMWQAAKSQAVPDGFVLVPMANISAFYQDDDEPENFANLDDGVSALGDCCDLDDIVAINKIEQAHISTEKMWGAFKIVDGTSSFTLFNNELDAIAARDKTVAHYMEVHV